ncbi:MAG: VacJ family lipoprotein, partial [Rhodospirillales bacterium]|nr:VacJ family lipoprotein [Rhodospirillales bacterium]
HEEDAGQTFATTLGLPDGPYLVLPVFGPSNPRDALGLAVDFIADPVNIVARRADRDTILPTVRSGVTAIDARARNIDTIEDLRKNSVDFYATIRSVYRQRRANEIRNGAPGSNFPAPSLSGESAPVSTQAASPQQ